IFFASAAVRTFSGCMAHSSYMCGRDYPAPGPDLASGGRRLLDELWSVVSHHQVQDVAEQAVQRRPLFGWWLAERCSFHEDAGSLAVARDQVDFTVAFTDHQPGTR